MATPHLTFRAKDTETVNPLLRTVDDSDDGQGGSGHLLIVRRASAWSSKTLVVPPDREYYAAAVYYGTASDTWQTSADTDLAANGGNTAWNSLDETAWHEGHKPVVQYLSKGYGPWWVRNASSSVTTSTALKIYESGGARQNLHFNCRAIPWAIGTASSTFKAYLRFWNPSCLIGNVDSHSWPDYEDSAFSTTGGRNGTHVICQADAFSFDVNGYSRAWYIFNDDGLERTPNAILDSDAGYCTFAGFANCGHGGTNTNYGERVYALRYDIWNCHHYSSAPALINQLVRTGIYAQGSSSANFTTAAYYADHEITGTQLAALRKNIRDTGGTWMQIGFRPCSINGTYNSVGFYPINGSTMTVYTSRIDLVFKVTASAAN